MTDSHYTPQVPYLQGLTVIVGPKYAGKTLMVGAIIRQALDGAGTAPRLITTGTSMLLISAEKNRIVRRITNNHTRPPRYSAQEARLALYWPEPNTSLKETVTEWVKRADSDFPTLIIVDDNSLDYESRYQLEHDLLRLTPSPDRTPDIIFTTLPNRNQALQETADNTITVANTSDQKIQSVMIDWQSRNHYWTGSAQLNRRPCAITDPGVLLL